MNEKQWTYLIEELLNNSDLGENIKVKPFVKVPYAREITSYDSNFNELESNTAPYETDILVYEEIKGVIKPRVIIELKVSSVTTHDAITYSDKAIFYIISRFVIILLLFLNQIIIVNFI